MNKATEEQALAQATLDAVAKWAELKFENRRQGCGVVHILNILEQVSDGTVTGAKAHRFIGWAQGVLCMEGCLSLNAARKLNKKVIEDSE